MFSYEQRMAAVNLYLECQSYKAVMNALGYPTKNALKSWVKEYKQNNELHKYQSRASKYSEEQIAVAVNHYLNTGRNVSKTLHELGYSNCHYLKQWIEERVPDYKGYCKSGKLLVHLPENIKKQAVIDFCERNKTAENIANDYGVNRTALYNWKKEKLGDKDVPAMPKRKAKKTVEELKIEIDEFNQQAEELKRQVYRLQLEKDILEKASEVIKKDPGIKLQQLTNKEKTMVINTLREKYSHNEL